MDTVVVAARAGIPTCNESEKLFSLSVAVMPLIIICGFPCSGKSTRANQLKSFCEQAGRKVFLVSDSGADKIESYANSRNEMALRGALKAEVEKYISRDDVTILDSLNYIKGYRYELHCIVKSHKTLHCIFQTIVHEDKCAEWNTMRSGNKYSDESCRELMMRFEPPNSQNRWDSPLFSLKPEDKIPFQEIDATLFARKAPPPNQSTMSTPLSSVNFLYELDRITQELIIALLEAQKTSFVGDEITLPNSSEKILLLKFFTMAELRKLKKQFLTYTKMHPIEDTSKIGNMFVQYLNNSR